MKKKKPKLENFINSERGFTLLRCPQCGDFFSKGKKHECGETNSYTLETRLIKEDKCTTK